MGRQSLRGTGARWQRSDPRLGPSSTAKSTTRFRNGVETRRTARSVSKLRTRAILRRRLPISRAISLTFEPAKRSAGSLGALKSISRQFDELDGSLTPRARLTSVIGDVNAVAVLEGFAALLERPDLPSPADAATVAVTGRRGTWWIALLAGLEEAWEGRGETDEFSDEFWRSALAIQLVTPLFEYKEQRRKILRWREAILEMRPELAREAYAGGRPRLPWSRPRAHRGSA